MSANRQPPSLREAARLVVENAAYFDGDDYAGYKVTPAKLMDDLRASLTASGEAESELRMLWLEWLEEGTYDGLDLLRRVRLAVHGPLRRRTVKPPVVKG